MTVSSQTNNATFVGNGVTTDFPLPFRFFSNGDVFAYFIDPTTGASTPMVLGTDYTLTGAGEPEVNGNAVSVLTTTAPLANLRGLYVERIMQEVQSTDIVNQGEFFASTHEDVFDRITMLIQQANANSNGAIRVAIGDPEPRRLAPAARRANLILGFDALGQPITVAPVSGSATDLAINLANNTDPTKGAGMVGFKQAGAGAVERTVSEKLMDTPTVADKGASKDASSATNTEAIQTCLDEGNTCLLRGGYSISAPLKYKSERAISGVHYGFEGSVLRPVGDFSTLVGHDGATAWTRTSFRDFMIDGAANTSAYAMVFNQCYLMDVERVWLRDCFRGISVSHSDSITFKDVLVMENARSEAVFVGDNARSIRFFGCNFETSAAFDGTKGSVRVEGYGATQSSTELHGCQFERSRLSVVSGSAKMFGGKVADGAIVLWPRSQASVVEADLYGSTAVHDFGWGNRIVNAYCQNMATPLHKWPDLPMAAASASTPTFGAAGDEYVYLVSAGARSSAGVSGGLIEVREGATVKSASPSFNIVASGISTGLNERSAFSFLSVVKNAAGASGPVVTNANIFAIKGGKNLLTNGTFDGGASTGWTLVNASVAPSGDDIVVTPSGMNWGMYQDFGANLTQGKRYIAVAKFSGAAGLVLGQAWDGSAGSRPLAASGIENLYGDGDSVAMLSFEYYASLGVRVSLGRVGSNTPVTVRWIAVIECP